MKNRKVANCYFKRSSAGAANEWLNGCNISGNTPVGSDRKHQPAGLTAPAAHFALRASNSRRDISISAKWFPGPLPHLTEGLAQTPARLRQFVVHVRWDHWVHRSHHQPVALHLAQRLRSMSADLPEQYSFACARCFFVNVAAMGEHSLRGEYGSISCLLPKRRQKC
jgi:hypothetical protein